MDVMYTSPSAQGVTLPYSGKLISLILEGSALRQPIYEAAGETLPMNKKTLQRYFNGAFLKDQQENIERILEHLAQLWWPEQLERFPTLNLQDMGKLALRRLMHQWDELAQCANTEGFKLHDAQEQLLVMARFGTLELGLRLGALFTVLGISHQRVTRLCENDALGVLIEEHRGDQSWEEFIKPRHKTLTLQSLHLWRTGKSLPQEDSLQNLVDCCVSHQPEQRALTLVALRLARLSVWVWKGLEEKLDENFMTKLKTTFLTTLRLTQNYLHEQTIMAGPSDLLYIEPALSGSSHPYGKALCKDALMPPSEMFEDITLDLEAMIEGKLSGRVQYWVRKVGSVGVELRAYQADPNVKAQLLEQIRSESKNIKNPDRLIDAMTQSSLNLIRIFYGGGAYDETFDGPIHVIRPPVEIRGYNEYDNLIAQGKQHEAAQLMRERLKEAPNAANAHYTYFSLAAALGQIIGKAPNLPFNLYVEAMQAIERAIKLAPSKGVYHNERALILSNAKMRAQAEEAYILAEPLYSHQATHWDGRGMNYLYLGEFEKAQQAFEKVIECTVDGEHIRAMALLAVVLMKNGHHLRAGKLGAALEKRGHRNPVPHWEDILKPFGHST